MPFRVLKNLYRLGGILDEHPHLLHVGRVFLQNQTTPDDDEQNVSVVGSEVQKDSQQLQAPATASQVYHAAILNGNTLDDLLAVFEVSDGPSNGSQTPVNTCLLCSEGSCNRYRNSSIQTTPEGVMTPRKPSTSHKEVVHDVSPTIDRNLYGELTRAISPICNEEHEEHEDQAAGIALPSSPLTSTCCPADGDAEQVPACENTSPGNHVCQTFARRQAQSRLPQRTRSGVKEVKEPGNLADAKSLNHNAGSPLRRNKLHRTTSCLVRVEI